MYAESLPVRVLTVFRLLFFLWLSPLMFLVLASIYNLDHLLLHGIDHILLRLHPPLHQLQLLIHMVELIQLKVTVLALALLPFSLPLGILPFVFFFCLFLVVFFFFFEY